MKLSGTGSVHDPVNSNDALVDWEITALLTTPIEFLAREGKDGARKLFIAGKIAGNGGTTGG